MEWSESFKNKIKSTVERINSLFTSNDINNSIITLDFTFFFPEDKQKEETNEWNVLIYQYAPDEYVTLLDKLREEYGDKFAKFPDKTKVVADLNNESANNNLTLKFQNPKDYKKETLNTDDFTPEDWRNDLSKKNFGGASIVVSREYKHERYDYNIQAGVYLILKKKFGCFTNSTYEIENKNKASIDAINGNDTNKKVVKDIWLILENLLFDEMFEIVVEKFQKIVSEKEEIERLRNVSASTHVIKTTINGLFAPSLNSLLQEENVDPRIKELQTAKEKFIKYAEVINLMSKLSSPYEDEIEIKESLTRSELFTENEKGLGNIKSVLNEIIALRERNPLYAKLTFVCNKDSLSEKAFVYANEYYPAKSFYELLLLTIIENVVEHGAADDGKLTVTMNLFEKEITFVNKSKPNSKKEFRGEDMTGNFRVFRTILNRLELGEFNISNENGEFKVTLKTKENG